ncbi:Death-associated protein kinase 2 [Armadillidium vulgare]|nr:Death-associated protein kinase 2 [Armadillidium vulgare]
MENQNLQIITKPIDELYEIYEQIGRAFLSMLYRPINALRHHFHMWAFCNSEKMYIEKSTRTEYAAKFIKKRRTTSSRRGLPVPVILREVEVLQNLGSHSNIISLHQVFDNGQNFILVLELVRGGELFEHISHKERLSEEEASLFVKQILEGIKHMHSLSVVHLDLKPENVLLLSRNHHHIKLIDFGLSRKVKLEEDIREMLGTAEFVAPEIVSYEPLSIATDMWAVGVITYILLSGTSPFMGETKQDIFCNISGVSYSFSEDLFPETSELAKDFISNLLLKDPRKRMTAEESLRHPWISPQSLEQEEEIKQAATNIINLKSYQARHRWKVLVLI